MTLLVCAKKLSVQFCDISEVIDTNIHAGFIDLTNGWIR